MRDPGILSETIQEFGGVRYYLCDRYFQNKGVRLHRVVWETSNGEIPDGYHVHHINEDRADNRLENLALLQGSEHLSLHNSTEEAKQRSRGNLGLARIAAAKWHGSPEGIAWHKEQYAKNCKGKTHVLIERTCGHCEKIFQGVQHAAWCSNRCKSAARRDSGIDNVDRPCVGCGTVFRINKYQKTRYCSLSCSRNNNARLRK